MKEKNLYIEGLRGCALILVLIYHFFCRYQQIFPIEGYICPYIITTFGNLGVMIFLMITGYFTKSSGGGYKLILKRVFRLWPSYFVAITSCFVVMCFFPLPERSVSFGNYLLNVLFINGFLGKDYVDGAHWYLTTLLGCILCYSIIQKHKQKMRNILYLLWLLLLVIIWLLSVKINSSYGKWIQIVFRVLGGEYAPVMLCGTLMGIHKNQRSKMLYKIVFTTLVLGEVVLFLGTDKIYLLILGTVVVYSATLEKLQILSSPIMVWMGTVSYSVYLIHQNIGYVILNGIRAFWGTYELWMSVAVMGIMFGIGVLLYHSVERKSLKLLGFLKKTEGK